jgi:hypothetical protein
MALTLYRRHRKECEGGHPEDSRTSQFYETRRGWKKCGCLIHVSGTLGGKFRRVHTGKANWEEAKTVIERWQTAQSWHGQSNVVPDPSSAGAATGS